MSDTHLSYTYIRFVLTIISMKNADTTYFIQGFVDPSQAAKKMFA